MVRRRNLKGVILTWGLLFVLILQGTVAYAADTTIEIDLQKAIDTSIEKSNTLKLYDEKIKNANDIYYYYSNLSIAASNKQSHGGVDLNPKFETDYDLIENKKIELLYPKQKLGELNRLKYEKQNKIIDIKAEVIETYFNILFAQRQISNKQGLLSKLGSELKVKQNNVKIGKGKASEITEVQLSIKRGNKELTQIIRDKDKLIMSLNALLGNSFENKIVLKEMGVPEVDFEIDIKSSIENKQKNSFTIQQIKNRLNEISIEAEIIKNNTNREDPIELKSLESERIEQEYKLKQELVDVETYILKENNNILNLIDDVEISKMAQDECEQNYKVSQEKQKLGIVSRLSLDEVNNKLEQAKVEYLKSKLDFYLEVLKFNGYLEKK